LTRLFTLPTTGRNRPPLPYLVLGRTQVLQWVTLLSILAGVLDLAENVGITVLLSIFPSVPPMLAATLGLLRQRSWYSSTSPPFWWCSPWPA
jgi:hypothetical protein